MRILGLDVGDKRIGVALSDPMGILASTLTVLHRKGDDSELLQIMNLVREWDVGMIVIGFPRSMDGRVGPQADKSAEFSLALSQLTELPIEFQDERLSTSIAEKILRDSGKSPRQIKEKVDAVAAALILQWYLDEHKPVTDTRTNEPDNR